MHYYISLQSYHIINISFQELCALIKSQSIYLSIDTIFQSRWILPWFLLWRVAANHEVPEKVFPLDKLKSSLRKFCGRHYDLRFVARVTRRVHTHGERTAYASGASEFTRGFGGVRDGQSLAYRVVCYLSSFVRLFFIFLSLYSLLLFSLWLHFWYLQCQC
jgi:hypothetical protein